MFRFIILLSFIISFNLHANPLDDLSWVKGQVLSTINNKQSTWTPTDFAIARGDSISSVSKIQIAKDVVRKSNVKLPNIINNILIWIK